MQGACSSRPEIDKLGRVSSSTLTESDSYSYVATLDVTAPAISEDKVRSLWSWIQFKQMRRLK